MNKPIKSSAVFHFQDSYVPSEKGKPFVITVVLEIDYTNKVFWIYPPKNESFMFKSAYAENISRTHLWLKVTQLIQDAIAFVEEELFTKS